MSDALRWVSAADGTRIAYSVVGHGPTLMLTNGLTTCTTFWKYLAESWASRHRVISWDLPGHGWSRGPRTPGCLEIEAQPDIMARIMDAEGVEHATQIGFSVGCQIVLELARQQPARCDALVLLLGAAGNVFTTLQLPVGKLLPQLLLAAPRPLFVAWYRALALGAGHPAAARVAKKLGLVGVRTKNEDLRELLLHLTTLDPVCIQHMARCAARHSAHEVLATLAAPLLIVAGASDPFAPVATVGRVLHEAAPGSELVELPEGTHTAMLEDPEAILEAVDRFLARHPGRHQAAPHSSGARS